MEHVRRTTDGLSDTEWQVRDGKRSKGKPKRRWYPSMAGELHGQEKQRIDREVEGSGGGLLPVVEGHSLGTRYKYKVLLLLSSIYLICFTYDEILSNYFPGCLPL